MRNEPFLCFLLATLIVCAELSERGGRMLRADVPNLNRPQPLLPQPLTMGSDLSRDDLDGLRARILPPPSVTEGRRVRLQRALGGASVEAAGPPRCRSVL